MLDLDSDKIDTDMNLNDVTILKQALILLCQARFEADATHIKITSHINYDVISCKIASVIQ